MTLATGTRLGPYEIVAPLGAGGMGEVYRARDTRLGREVAVKVLPPQVASDPARVERFEREARAASALNHVNVLALFDVGHEAGVHFLVTELLEGRTLRQTLERGPIPLRAALDFAAQISDGLAAAHGRGIAHRDLKPDNLFLTSDGRVKILDFGLARLVAAPASPEDVTIPRAAVVTEAGVVLGTPGYMAPEQLRGLAADHRTDLFAFGIVLYEMLSGRCPFRRESPADTSSAILRDEPAELSVAIPEVPAAVSRLVAACLRKDPRERWQNARDLSIALAAVRDSRPEAAIAAGEAQVPARATRTRFPAAWIGLAATLAILAFIGARFVSPPRPTEATEVHFSLAPPDGGLFTPTADPILPQIAVSPSGRDMIFVAEDRADGTPRLWLRRLDQAQASPLPDTDGANFPFWSPDGRHVAFATGSRLRRLEVGATAARTVCVLPPGALVTGGTWGSKNVIVFAHLLHRGLVRVDAGGGEPQPLTSVDTARGETSHRWPWFMPDGDRFIFWARLADPPRFELRSGSLASSQTASVVDADSGAAYAERGFLLAVRNGALFRWRFDARAMRVTGEPTRIADGLGYGAPPGYAPFSVGGSLLAFARLPSGNRELRFYDRAGGDLGCVGEPGRLYAPDLSPDGRFVAVSERKPDDASFETRLVDLQRGVTTSFGEPGDRTALWSPDGTRLASRRDHQGVGETFIRPVVGGRAEMAPDTLTDPFPTDWSAACGCLVVHTLKPGTGWDIVTVALSGDRAVTPFASSPASEIHGRISPDGRWMAYASDEEGRFEVYLRSFPDGATKLRVSSGGGAEPAWRADGRELVYVAADGTFMSVAVGPGAMPSLGRPAALFKIDLPPLMRPFFRRYAITRDASRVLAIHVIQDERRAPIDVVSSWLSESVSGRK